MFDLSTDLLTALCRRQFLRASGLGIGSIALASLLRDDARGAEQPEASAGRLAGGLHFAPKAKHLIYLHMAGGPSQLDLFDHKPALTEHSGEVCPQELIGGDRFAFLGEHPKLLGSPYKFARHGQSGAEVSELLPHLAKHVDDIAIVKSMQTEEFNHGPAQVFQMTGFGRQGRPSIGSWLNYGLGSENQDLPAFVVLLTGLTPGGGTSLWGGGFLPSMYAGVQFRTRGEPVLFVENPRGIDRPARGRMLAALRQLNEIREREVGDPEITSRIASYELAYRMQASVPELMDLSSEPKHIHRLYGGVPHLPSFANNCLLARRLIERGTRIVQLFDQEWDHHTGIYSPTVLPKKCRDVDRGIAALLTDLKQRDLLDETLVVWGGEFGRTPMMEDRFPTNLGRDHHKDAFTMWLAGGGIKPGITLGRTDELGYHAVENPVHVHDLNATILHLMGIDHTRLTYRYQGREFRLTDVAGRVVNELLA